MKKQATDWENICISVEGAYKIYNELLQLKKANNPIFKNGQKNTVYDSTYEIPRIGKFLETGSKLEVVRGIREWIVIV